MKQRTSPRTPLKYEALAFQLHGAAQAVAAVRQGTALPQALENVFARTGAPPPARGAVQDIAYRTMRRLGTADALLSRLAAKPPSPPLLRALLQCALALLTEKESDAPYDAFTVVNQAVDATAADPTIGMAKGMVNAVLRRFLREREALLRQVGSSSPALWNYPSWWIDDMRAAYPDDWENILQAGNRPPPLTLRVNRRRTNAGAYLQMLADAGIAARRIGSDAVRLDRPMPVFAIPGFADGIVSVQDAAAQLAAPLLDLQDGMRVLDACAAPGGKTGHMLECADIDLTALDQDARRLIRVTDNLKRLGLAATLREGDAATNVLTADGGWWDGQPFDRILADVPCTASGIVRRHPDIRWLRRQSDADALTTVSARILDNLWQMLRPDGKLLFVTCSVWPKESARQADAFAARSDAIRLPAPGQLLPSLPITGPDDSRADPYSDHDGLFYALFQKKTSH